MLVAGLILVLAVVAVLYMWLKDPTLPPADVKEGDIRRGFTTKAFQSLGDLDVIVVGSGMGGLTTAALLAKLGKKVLVLEQHDVAGGCTHAFVDKGFEFDVGLHYVGGDFDNPKRNIVSAVFDSICSSPVQWSNLGETFDMAVFPGQRVPMKAGFKELRSTLMQEFPEDSEAIKKYFDLVRDTNLDYGRSFVWRALPDFVANWLRPVLWEPALKHSNRTVAEVLDSLTGNEKLKNVLAYVCGDYGLPPSRASWVIHCAVVAHYFKGAYYPVGGASAMAKAIVPTIERAGGAVLVRAHVKKILLEEGRAVGVVVDKGGQETTIRAPAIVSAAGVTNTVMRLLPHEAHEMWPQPLEQIKLSKTLKPSVTHLNLFLGLRGDSDELKLPRYNTWKYLKNGSIDSMVEQYYATPPPSDSETSDEAGESDGLVPEVPFLFIAFPSAKDPDFKTRYPGKSVCTVVTEIPYGLFARWQETKLKHRGEEYDFFKTALQEQLLRRVLEEFPQLEGHIEYIDLGTPLSNNHYIHSVMGESYGLEHSPERFASEWLRPKTPIPGLWLAGQDVVMCGVWGAMMGGFTSACAMDLRVLFKNIHKVRSL